MNKLETNEKHSQQGNGKSQQGNTRYTDELNGKFSWLGTLNSLMRISLPTFLKSVLIEFILKTPIVCVCMRVREKLDNLILTS